MILADFSGLTVAQMTVFRATCRAKSVDCRVVKNRLARIAADDVDLSVIKDLFDGFIVAHRFEQQYSVGLVTKTIKQAQQKEKVTDGLILHSDQGHQYTSQQYHVLTNEYNLTPSMSRRGNCWDNAVVESFFHTLKVERVHLQDYQSRREATSDLFEYIEIFYNRQRLHSHLDLVSPAEFEQSWLEAKKVA